ncbi:MAG: single-stranded-DNA-specific exonuclease RecJ [Hyphomicrobiaceae bacterium]
MAGAAQRLTDLSSGEEDTPMLGVARSARGFVWRERLAPDAHNLAMMISQRHGLPELLGRILAARDIAVDDVPVTLDPTIKALMPDPSTLVDMDKAANRIADAIEGREAVAIFGDYDVDGACSSALMCRFLKMHGLGARIYIPDRIFEGYGPNPQAIETLVKEGARLIVTVDCGVTSIDALGHAKTLGADVVVLDHHQADENLPKVDAVVNPNRQDDLSGLGHLCAAGVTFMTMVATARTLRQRGFYGKGRPAPDLLSLLDLVALATVADVVPLRTLNRAFVVKGLEVMRQRGNIGLNALLDAARLNQPPTPYHLGFVLGPRINAGGRIGDAALGAKLLSIDDEAEAQRIAALLDKLNHERKAIETAMLEAAMAEADRLVDQDPDLPIVVVGSPEWHKGVVGLVASRLVERFRRPSCVIAWEDKGQGTGSLRSVAGVDIGAAVRALTAEGLLVKGGGHAMAAGLTVAPDKLEAVRQRFDAMLRDTASAARASTALEIDGALTPAGVSDDLLQLIDKAGPFGQGNPSPRFVFPAHRVRFSKVMGDVHLRCTLEAGDGSRLDAIAFRAVGQPVGDLLQNANGLPLHIAGQLRRDTWGGRNRIELQIEDVAEPARR